MHALEEGRAVQTSPVEGLTEGYVRSAVTSFPSMSMCFGSGAKS
jgi:hypothetical protein